MNVANDSSLQLYSSAIQKLGEKSPLEVKIRHLKISQSDARHVLRNAAVTLGVEHARITVAAPIPVTGESALLRYLLFLSQIVVNCLKENKDLAQEGSKALSDVLINKDKSGDSM